ncbi:hypothetical protein [Kitasatospora purpeofusca]|uniref:hypothetical protein n=1 Tax=Kitasatospora purpeofusca TaxID=67352 RepID=UPI002A5AF288|nr:hypothetical protein [Kitasatospora purpeofusca]MDY0814801.1 hypothetical protein [Kitasatospora purpeofusca]
MIADTFHWLDRPRVLAALDTLVRPGGFVAVVGYRAPGTPREWWHPLLVPCSRPADPQGAAGAWWGARAASRESLWAA